MSTLEVRNLRVGFTGPPRSEDAVVRGVDLSLQPGRCLALVGESGSGKSVTARSLVGLSGGTVAVDRLELDGEDLTELANASPSRATERAWRRIRGARIGTVLQDALGSLDPLRAIGPEVADAARLAHVGLDLPGLLTSVGLDPSAARRRPDELSGGMRQRALIAAALAADPPVVVADEPTTALDTTRQAVVLDLLRARVEAGGTLLFITHDLAAARRVADDVVVMEAGRIVETGPIAEVLSAPTSAEGRRLIASVPWERPRGRPLLPDAAAQGGRAPAPQVPPAGEERPGVGQRPVLEGTGLTVRYRGEAEPAVVRASLSVARGETLGLVGESGSGKSTLLRALATLVPSEDGEVRLHGAAFSSLPERRRRALRGRMAMIVQDPLGSFEPRWSVGQILRDALPRGSRTAARVTELLEAVHLPPSSAAASPATLSGGQRQRVAIARALAVEPEVLLCDEPVSALDASVQARVLDLLDELQREHGLAILLVSHDLGVIRHASDRIAVMENGRIVETGDTEAVLGAPEHRFTKELITAAPRLR